MKVPNLSIPVTAVHLALLLLIFNSCESDICINAKDGQTKIYAYSEISPDSEIKVFVNTAVGINTTDDFFFPEQNGASVTLYRDGIMLENPGFRYIKSQKSFVSQGPFRPKPGIKYGLHVALKDQFGVESIYGETSIPFTDTLKSVKIVPDGDGNFNITLNFSDTKNEYFLVRLSIHNAMEQEVEWDVMDVNYAGKRPRTLNKGELLLHKNVKDAGLQVLGFSKEELKGGFLNVELQSITKDAYKYYKTRALQTASQNISFSEPVISQSNFDRGLGLFTGFSTSHSKFFIQ